MGLTCYCAHVLQNNATRSNAEAVLLEFRQAHQAMDACRHILEHSASQPACFQVNSVFASCIVPAMI